MSSINTRYTDPKDSNFPYSGLQVAWVLDKDPTPRYQAPKGMIHLSWSNLYKPVVDALRWDGIPEGDDVYAIGSTHGIFGYVKIERRGRVLREIPGAGRTKGILARITFGLGSEYESDIHSEDCWLVERAAD